MDDETNAKCLLVWADLVSSFNALNDLPDQNRMEVCKSLIHLLDDKIEKQTSQSYIGNPVVPTTIAITSVDVAPVEDKPAVPPVEETPPPSDVEPEDESEDDKEDKTADDNAEDEEGDDVKDAVKKVKKANGSEEEDESEEGEEEDDDFYESMATCRLFSDPVKVKKAKGKDVVLMVENLTIGKSIATFSIGSKQFKTPIEKGNMIAMNVFVSNEKLASAVKLEKATGPAHWYPCRFRNSSCRIRR